MNRILSSVLLCVTILLCLCSCNHPSTQTPDNTSPYTVDFLNYEGVDGISDIQEINLSTPLKDSCKTYKFTYSVEGVSVKAYISIPLACSEEADCKVLLYNRGGNSKIGLLTDNDTARICSLLNRVVIASQYRGADGGGGHDEFGGKDLQDVSALLDLAENTFAFTDMDDLVCAGVSRGGMMSYMLARTDSRVDRVISISAVSNLKQAYNEREDMKKILTSYIGGSPEALPDEYANRSAINWAEEITIPVLMIHSKGDAQVSYSQAAELKAAFDRCGTECTLITHNDDTHGIHYEDFDTIANWLGD